MSFAENAFGLNCRDSGFGASMDSECRSFLLNVCGSVMNALLDANRQDSTCGSRHDLLVTRECVDGEGRVSEV
jgi:hypothetical protein